MFLLLALLSSLHGYAATGADGAVPYRVTIKTNSPRVWSRCANTVCEIASEDGAGECIKSGVDHTVKVSLTGQGVERVRGLSSCEATVESDDGSDCEPPKQAVRCQVGGSRPIYRVLCLPKGEGCPPVG